MGTKVKIVNKSAYPVPAYATELSAGMDLKANITEPVTIASLERAMIPTGIYIELPEGYEAQIRPRSGLAAKFGVTVANAPGTVDADYRGEVKVILVNLSKEPFVINPGERIAQMVIAKYEKIEWEEVEELGDTERGAGGFGSTGRK
ncbi:MAG: dUTP diphosphatase [Bacteroidales bacterium]|nr:dUTP diphosphatase [Bacteroidales bacterium]MBQ8033946.1 dUTP diphosphatase [Bacteroidales bacterium]